MKKIALSLSLLLPLLFFACKKNNDNNGDTPAPQPQMRVALINVSDSTDYTVVGLNLPDVPLLKPGTAKTYILNQGDGLYTPLFCRQGKADTFYFQFNMRVTTEHVFIMRDGNLASASYLATDCFEPPAGKSIIRYLNVSSYSKMEIADATNTNVLLTYNSGRLNPWADTVALPQSAACNSFPEGSYTFRVYADATPNSPAVEKTNVHIDKNHVYYVYLTAKNELKILKR
jgi:hypothetical protein